MKVTLGDEKNPSNNQAFWFPIRIVHCSLRISFENALGLILDKNGLGS